MADTNGNVTSAHLVTYQGVLVSLAILADLRAAGDEFRAEGHTFSIAMPWGGYRPYDIQGEMRADYLAHKYARFNLSPPPSPAPASAGHSRHGYGRAVDVISNASPATRDSIMAEHNFKLWSTADRNHYEWGNVLVAADVSSVPIVNTESQEDPMAGPYRLFSRVDNGVTTLALGVLDPNWQTKGHNFWAEAEASTRADWTDLWGPAYPLPPVIWNSRSNDPNRISDLTKFPMFAAPSPAAPVDAATIVAIGAEVIRQQKLPGN